MKRLTNKEKEIMDLYCRLLRRAEASLQYTLHDGAYPGEERIPGSPTVRQHLPVLPRYLGEGVRAEFDSRRHPELLQQLLPLSRLLVCEGGEDFR